MASTARKIKLDAVNTKRMRSVTLPISSAGMHPPRPHPGPARATEKSANSGQADRNGNEPGHDPPGEWLGSQDSQPSFLGLPPVIRNSQKRTHQRGRHKNRPGVKRSEKGKQNQRHDQDGLEMRRGTIPPERAAFDVYVEVRNDDHQYLKGNRLADEQMREGH